MSDGQRSRHSDTESFCPSSDGLRWTSVDCASGLAANSALPSVRLERSEGVKQDAHEPARVVSRRSMDAWQQDAFDRLLTDCGASSFDVELHRHRAPRLIGSQNWLLSASHTGTGARRACTGPLLAVAAQQGEFGSQRVGVDVEQHRPRSAASIAAMEKLLAWPSASGSSLEFYRRWTAAEAIYKTGLVGVGTSSGWFERIAPLAAHKPLRAHSGVAESNGVVCFGEWEVCLGWQEMPSQHTLCLVSARRLANATTTS